MASLHEFMQAKNAKRKQSQELHEHFKELKATAFSKMNDSYFKDNWREIEAFLVLKLGVHGFLAWREYVNSIPAAADKFFLKSLKSVLAKFCDMEEIHEDETKHCIDLTRMLRKTEDVFKIDDKRKEIMEAGQIINHPTFKILAPPVAKCTCRRTLSMHNTPSNATIFSLDGAFPAAKVTLKCQACKLYYGYRMYGNKDRGYQYYEEDRELIECSNETYVSRELCTMQVALTLHSQVSFEGFAEAYGDFLRDAIKNEFVNTANQLQKGKSSASHQYTSTADRRIVSKAFYANETKEEMKERNLRWIWKGTESDEDDFMEWVEKERSQELYPHNICTDSCKQRGCHSFTVFDGVWKLRHPHCMWPVSATATNFPGLNMPDVCTNEPASQISAFCKHHANYANSKGIPSGLRDFLKYFCGVEVKKTDNQQPDIKNIEDVKKVEEKISLLPPCPGDETSGNLAEAQGIVEVLALAEPSEANIVDDDNPSDSLEKCNKDTGDNQKVLRKWSRGLLHFVRGGGHIEKWSPLYKAESPGQVILITIQYLYQRLKDTDPESWKEFGICYDNMCNLCNLKAAVQPLHLPKPYDKLWINVSKYIDDLHLRNHKRKECKEKFSTEKLRETLPNLNTPVCEQTFVWASKFKKIMCAMPKRRFLFFYHRMVTRRNRYTENCYLHNKKPLLPASRRLKND